MALCFGKNGNKKCSEQHSHGCRKESIKREIIQLKQEILNLRAATYELEYNNLKSKIKSDTDVKIKKLSHQSEAREEAIKMLEDRVEELEDAELWLSDTKFNTSDTSSLNGEASDGLKSAELSFGLAEEQTNDSTSSARFDTSSSSDCSNSTTQHRTNNRARSLYFDQRRHIRQLTKDLRLSQEENHKLREKNKKLEKLISTLLLDDDNTKPTTTYESEKDSGRGFSETDKSLDKCCPNILRMSAEDGISQKSGNAARHKYQNGWMTD